MIDVEERFRSEVQHLPQAVHLDLGVDADALLAAGHRLWRTRALRRAASGVAGVIAISLLSFSVIADRAPTGVPEPAQSPSPTASAATDGTASATFELPDGGLTGRQQTLTFTVTRRGEDLTTETVLYDRDGTRLNHETTQSRTGDLPGTVQSGSDPLWGMVPAVAPGLSVTVNDPQGRIRSDYRVLQPIGVTVYVADFDQPADAAKIARITWPGRNGEDPQAPDRGPVTAAIDFNGHQGDFYLQRHLDTVGYAGRDGNGFSFRISEADSAARFMYSGAGTGATMWAMVVALLPPLAGHPTVAVAHSDVTWTTVHLGDRTLVVASGRSDTLAGLVKSVTYTDAGGKRVTQSVKR